MSQQTRTKLYQVEEELLFGILTEKLQSYAKENNHEHLVEYKLLENMIKFLTNKQIIVQPQEAE